MNSACTFSATLFRSSCSVPNSMFLTHSLLLPIKCSKSFLLPLLENEQYKYSTTELYLQLQAPNFHWLPSIISDYHLEAYWKCIFQLLSQTKWMKHKCDVKFPRLFTLKSVNHVLAVEYSMVPQLILSAYLIQFFSRNLKEKIKSASSKTEHHQVTFNLAQ